MRLALRFFVVAFLLVLVAVSGGYGYLRQSLPVTEGEIRVAGLSAAAEVLRDEHGIPHVFAASIEDAHFALGFVHAQDRLWQMEMNRRIAAGRMAEVLGAGALETDRFMRTLGVRRTAEKNFANYDGGTRRQLEAYAAGVNAFLATRPVLPPEFWILGVTPEPWSPIDSVAWTKMMAWDLGGNWRSELLRLRLSKTLPLARIQEFLPPYPGDSAVPLPDLGDLYRRMEREPPQVASSGSDPDLYADLDAAGLGSNSWVLAGARTASGKPLLANDPHLGLSAPSVWYFAHLHAPGLDAIGATLPGVPGVLLGRNERIAWGFTNTGPDVQDLYIEKIDAAGRYVAPEGPRAFTVIAETIKVKDAADEPLSIRISRHGPVISDVSRIALEATPRGHALAFAWTALAEDDRTVQAAFKVQVARDWPSFLEAARDFHVPQQNVTYADVEGNIGFIAAGRVPVRKPENDLKGLAPAPGWDARYDWAGYIPFAELPQRYNPGEGGIVTANQKIVDSKYPRYITSEWQPPYRARRIEALLAEKQRHGLPDFARIQADALSLGARELLPHVLRTVAKTEEARAALEMLGAWDGTMSAGLSEPLIAVAWWRQLARAIYADELGEAFRSNWSPRAMFLANVLADRDGQARWCDDIRTQAVETCDELLARSLEAALADLRKRYGNEMRDWKWGDAHVARHTHRPFSREPRLAMLFDIGVPSAGDAYTVNVGQSDFNDEAEPYANRHAASLRAIYDLSDPQASMFIHSTGQSGNPLSGHYRSFAVKWARGEYVAMVTERAKLQAAGAQRLVLAPRK